MKKSSLLLPVLWASMLVFVGFFLGKAMMPEAALYTRMVSDLATAWLAAVPKMVFQALGAVAAWGVVRRLERDNPARSAWAIFAAGLVGLLLGQATLAWYLARGQGGVFPSLADLFFVAGTVAVAVSLASFVRVYVTSGLPIGPRSTLWGIGAGAAAVSALLVVPILVPVAKAPAPAMEKALNIVYPSLDFAMLIPAVLLLSIALRFRGGSVAGVWIAIVAGTLFTAAGDILFGYFSSLGQADLEAVIDALYLLAYGCMAAGALAQRELVSGA